MFGHQIFLATFGDRTRDLWPQRSELPRFLVNKTLFVNKAITYRSHRFQPHQSPPHNHILRSRARRLHWRSHPHNRSHSRSRSRTPSRSPSCSNLHRSRNPRRPRQQGSNQEGKRWSRHKRKLPSWFLSKKKEK